MQIKKFGTLLTIFSLIGFSTALSINPVKAQDTSYCQPSSAYGYQLYTSQSSYAAGQAIDFCLVNNTRTPMFLVNSQWEIKDSNGNVIYNSPAPSSDQNASYTGPYYSSWNQLDNSGNQVAPGTYALVYITVDQPQTTFTIQGNNSDQNQNNNSGSQNNSGDNSGDQNQNNQQQNNNQQNNSYGNTPFITLSSYDVYPGESITVNGQMFGSGQNVNISFNGQNYSATADSNGSFSQTINIGNLSAGKYSISADGASPISFAVKGYYPNAEISSYYIQPGDALSFSGSGFAPNETVTLSENGSALGSYTADGAGNLTISGLATIPQSAMGSSQIYTLSSANFHRDYKVIVAGYYPNITPDSYYLQQGQSFIISGSGFAPNETVNLSFNGSSIAGQADDSGNVSWTATAPASGGNYPMTATGANSGASSSRTVTVAQ